jgi:predicted ester cyclase
MIDNQNEDRQDAKGPTINALDPAKRRALMPKDYTISLDRYVRGGTDRFLLSPPTTRTQSLRGFEEDYTDIIDYIVRITHRIWEEGGIGYIYDYYRHNSRVHDDFALQYGRDKIVADTVMMINAFPDIRLYADDVIWAGNDEVEFVTSHRTIIIGHNTGYSRFGPPTGRKVVIWCIANCTSLENEIYEEWVLYNHSSLMRQLGFNLIDKAREMAEAGISADLSGLRDPRFGEPSRVPGQGKPPVYPPASPGAFDVEDFIRRALHEVWNWRLLNKLHDYYLPNMRFHGPTDREYYGLGAYKSFVLSMIAMFPDLALSIDEVYYMGNDGEGYRASTRWSIVGTHRGPGIYGQPTGKPVYLWGITQHIIKDGKVSEEWMVFNEFAVLQQLFA